MTSQPFIKYVANTLSFFSPMSIPDITSWSYSVFFLILEMTSESFFYGLVWILTIYQLQLMLDIYLIATPTPIPPTQRLYLKDYSGKSQPYMLSDWYYFTMTAWYLLGITYIWIVTVQRLLFATCKKRTECDRIRVFCHQDICPSSTIADMLWWFLKTETTYRLHAHSKG